MKQEIPQQDLLTGNPAIAQTLPAYTYNQPFLQPAPVWDYWFLLLFPLLIAICVVYKTVKVGHIKDLPRQVASMLTWLVLGLAGAAIGLWLFVKITG